MANLMWGTKTPGHLVYLIDQSGSMSGDNEKKAAEAVHKALLETLKGCVNGKEVKNRVYITIIGYGNENGVSILREGWIGDFVSDMQQCTKNGTFIVEPKSYGNTPMTEAFELAKKCLTTWINAREQQQDATKIPAPIVINITDGYPDDADTATQAAQDVMNIATQGDGNVLVFNIHMDDSDNNLQILFPLLMSELNGVREGEFLFGISSPMTTQMVAAARAQKFEGLKPNAKGMVVNAKGDTLVRFVTFGSAVSQQKS